MAKKKKRERGPRPHLHKVVRYYDAQGERCSKDAPGARKVVEETDTYYATFWANGKRQRVSLRTTDITVAWQRLRAEQRRRVERELGIRDHLTDAAEIPLKQHLDDWIAVVKTRKVTERHVWALRHSMDVLAEVARWETIADLDHDSCARALEKLMEPTKERPKGLSRQTRNHFLRHARQFGRWAAGPGRRLRVDPFAGLEPIDTSTDRRHDRRVPTDEEIRALFDSLELPDAAQRCRMTGAQRAMGYRVAMATGLRANELRSLGWQSFDLAGGVVTLAAAYSKRRRQDAIPLPVWLADQLAVWFEAGGGCWADFPANWPGRLLVDDLEAAGVAYSVKDAAGNDLFFDFHALRHWYVSAMAHIPDISPKTLLALTRHSTPELTLKVYAKARGHDLREAANQTPEPGARRAERTQDTPREDGGAAENAAE